MQTRNKRLVRRYLLVLFFLVCGVLFLQESVRQARSAQEVAAAARKILGNAHATTTREKILAFRDYLRAHVTDKDAIADRPLFRASADEILHSGKGYCGEVSRVFI